MGNISVMVGLSSDASVSPVLMVNHGTGHSLPSPGTYCRDAGKFCRPFDMNGFRRTFPARFAAWLKSDMRHISTSDLATMFGTDEKTIRNWKAGKVAPSGHVVAVVAKNYPEAVNALTDGAAA